MPSYWIVVGSPDNFEKTAELGFTVQGLKSRHRKKAERMAKGDRLVWYITGEQAFAGIATIEGPCFEDHEPIWTPKKGGKKEEEDYPWRVPISKEVVLPRSEWVDAEGPARKMAHVAKWPAEHWRLAFQGNVHEISEADFEILLEAIQGTADVAS
jgi:hypothetical protein